MDNLIMDEKDLWGEKKERSCPRTRLFFITVAVFIGLFGIYGLVFGIGGRYRFFNGLSAVVSRSLGDVFGDGSGGRKLAAEIDLQADTREDAAKVTIDVPGKKSAEKQQPRVVESVSVRAEGGVANENDKVSLVSEAAKNGIEKNDSDNSPKVNYVLVEASGTVPNKKSSEKSIVRPACDFARGGNPTRKIVINEIAWMGSPPTAGETAVQAGNNEWFELKNNSGEIADLSGWQIVSQDGKIKIFFEGGEKVKGGQFYLLERTDDNSVPKIPADKIYSGAFSNFGEWLRMFDGSCNLVDEVNAASGWPGGDNGSKQTMERNAGDFGWHTSSAFGGTPKAENSPPQISTASLSPDQKDGNSANYILAVSMQGDGLGIVTSTPPGIRCGFDCSEEYSVGTSVKLTATPESNSVFNNWSGACTGKGSCVVSMAKATSVVANFTAVSPLATYVPPPTSGKPAQSPAAPQHILISEIMAGIDGNSEYEFVELYNPTSNQIDLTGWSVKKRSSSGAESSLLVSSRLQGKNIGSNKYFLAANDGGYTGKVAPDAAWAHSNTLAYTNNAVILYDAGGNKIEEVFWVEIPAGKSYARESWNGNNFITQETPTPQNSSVN